MGQNFLIWNRDTEVTILSYIDVESAEKYILECANCAIRERYSETNTCATLASEVAIKKTRL